MKFGAHLSIAKGPTKLLAEVEDLGMDAVQIFARNPRGRGETKLSDEEAGYFKSELRRRGWPLVIHAPYYVNVGSGVANNQRIAKEVLKLDLEKGDRIGAGWVVVHLGSPGDDCTIDECTDHTVRTVTDILQQTDAKTRLLLETSAGPNRVGSRFEQLGAILKGIGDKKRVGVCFDTCHVWVSGYDCKGAKMAAVAEEFERHIGWDRVDVIHCNDTESALGGGLDKHFHIGRGELGQVAFDTLVQDGRLQEKVFILETPKEADKTRGIPDADRVNLAALKSSLA